jgi:CheY-like chemotaxis protein
VPETERSGQRERTVHIAPREPMAQAVELKRQTCIERAWDLAARLRPFRNGSGKRRGENRRRHGATEASAADHARILYGSALSRVIKAAHASNHVILSRQLGWMRANVAPKIAQIAAGVGGPRLAQIGNSRVGDAHCGGASVQDPTLILIAEDDADNREGYAEYLTFLGYRVAQVANGEDAIALTADLRPDVLLLDLALPGVDGWEVARRVRGDSATGRTLIIALSACVFPGDVVRATEAGCDVFLDKPCYPQTVANEIKRLLASRDALQAEQS